MLWFSIESNFGSVAGFCCKGDSHHIWSYSVDTSHADADRLHNADAMPAAVLLAQSTPWGQSCVYACGLAFAMINMRTKLSSVVPHGAATSALASIITITPGTCREQPPVWQAELRGEPCLQSTT